VSTVPGRDRDTVSGVVLAFDPPVMRLAILGSGSRGNAIVVESAGRRVLIDAGFSGRELERRLRLVGVEPESLEGVVLTHEHSDHVRGVDRFARRYGLQVWATAGTLDSGRLAEETRRTARRLVSGMFAEIAGFELESFAVPHDATEPVGFVVQDGAGRRLGVAADLGCRSRLAWGRLAELDVLVLETNHDLGMLRNGPYPWHLKQRIAGRHGHLSNEEAAGGVPELVSDRLRWVVLYHLSQTNNSPALAADAVGEALAREGCAARLAVAEQDRPTEWLEVD
jgi:phosphoribosyl 1,2-cyclic phosphodiesterase